MDPFETPIGPDPLFLYDPATPFRSLILFRASIKLDPPFGTIMFSYRSSLQ